jgi:hypothetical protein
MFSGCVHNYHIQAFSNDIETLSSQTILKIVEDRKVEAIQQDAFTVPKVGYKQVAVEEIQGMFTASNYESAMAQAKNAGYTKVLSIEYGTNQYLGIIGTKWVTIRCVKDLGTKK